MDPRNTFQPCNVSCHNRKQLLKAVKNFRNGWYSILLITDFFTPRESRESLVRASASNKTLKVFKTGTTTALEARCVFAWSSRSSTKVLRSYSPSPVIGNDWAYETRLMARGRCCWMMSSGEKNNWTILTVLSVLLPMLRTRPVRTGFRYSTMPKRRTALGYNHCPSFQPRLSASLGVH